MIDLYYWPTPNGHKITLFLEETGMPYAIIPKDIGKGGQLNKHVPAIVDHTPMERGAPVSVFESGAILLYLAEKSERFIPQDLRGRVEVTQWLFWEAGGLGIPYGVERHAGETNRLHGELNQRLADREFVAGTYSIADMAAYPWIVPHGAQGQNLDDFPHLKRWFHAVKNRPATLRAYERGAAVNASLS